jgi:hypothetical protein
MRLCALLFSFYQRPDIGNWHSPYIHPRHQQLFDEVLASIHLLPDATAAEIPRSTQVQQGENNAEVNQLFGAASRLYLDHNYAAAAQVYEKALAL